MTSNCGFPEGTIHSHSEACYLAGRNEALEAAEIESIVAERVQAALRDTADAWQHGEWANAPRRPDRVQERIANAQFVTDWLRERADQICGPSVAGDQS